MLRVTKRSHNTSQLIIDKWRNFGSGSCSSRCAWREKAANLASIQGWRRRSGGLYQQRSVAVAVGKSLCHPCCLFQNHHGKSYLHPRLIKPSSPWLDLTTIHSQPFYKTLLRPLTTIHCSISDRLSWRRIPRKVVDWEWCVQRIALGLSWYGHGPEGPWQHYSWFLVCCMLTSAYTYDSATALLSRCSMTTLLLELVFHLKRKYTSTCKPLPRDTLNCPMFGPQWMELNFISSRAGNLMCKNGSTMDGLTITTWPLSLFLPQWNYPNCIFQHPQCCSW